MPNQFTIGIEEEYQLVDLQTGELRSSAQKVLDRRPLALREKLKPEILRPMLEYVSDILPDLSTARRELYQARAALSELAAEENLALISAGTHPTAVWSDHQLTPNKRYLEIEEEYREIGRSLLIFGLHIHIAVEPELVIPVMNQARTWLPHLLAISTNSPFTQRRDPNIKSYRSVIWSTSPRSGMPEVQASRQAFDDFIDMLVTTGRIDNAKKIWWDIRPHPFFGTLEFRICDMPATIEDVLGIAALCQALVARLVHLTREGKQQPIWSKDYLDENKWRAVRDGLDAVIIDFQQQRQISMRQALRDLFTFVQREADALGSQREMRYLRDLVESSAGTGADRQQMIYRRTGDWQKLQQYLMRQTMHGIEPELYPWLTAPLFPESLLDSPYAE